MKLGTCTMAQAHILVVDDEAPIRLTLNALLHRCGYHVTLAASGEQALALIASQLFDLVLLDLILAGMSGLDVARFARALRPTTKILMLTGSDQLAEVGLSGYDYLEKTSSPRAVLDRITMLVTAEPQSPEDEASQAEPTPWHAAMLDNVKHDLRNTLAIIQGNAKLLAHHVADADHPMQAAVAERLIALDSAVLQLDAQIAQLGHWPACPPARGSVDLVELARGSAASYQRLGAICIRLEPTTAQVVGTWDKLALTRALDNVLSNAVKYSPAGGSITIHIMAEQGGDGAWAIVRVCDQGIGIPAEALPNIFTPHYRAANVPSTITGSGLGLASARQLIAAEGGTITACSQLDTGTCFTIRLPLHEATG